MRLQVQLTVLLLVSFFSQAAQPQSRGGGADEDKIMTKPVRVEDGKVQDTASPAMSPDYVIGVDDTLHISVWKEPDFSGTLPVRPDGKISVPLLDDVQAAGLTPMQLANVLTEKLKKYVSEPRVTVSVTVINSRRIYILGEVSHSGSVPLWNNMTVLQALSGAGFSQFANVKGIYVLRSEGGKQTKLPFNYKQVIKGQHMEENIILKPGDTIIVP